LLRRLWRGRDGRLGCGGFAGGAHLLDLLGLLDEFRQVRKIGQHRLLQRRLVQRSGRVVHATTSRPFTQVALPCALLILALGRKCAIE